MEQWLDSLLSLWTSPFSNSLTVHVPTLSNRKWVRRGGRCHLSRADGSTDNCRAGEVYTCTQRVPCKDGESGVERQWRQSKPVRLLESSLVSISRP